MFCVIISLIILIPKHFNSSLIGFNTRFNRLGTYSGIWLRNDHWRLF